MLRRNLSGVPSLRQRNQSSVFPDAAVLVDHLSPCYDWTEGGVIGLVQSEVLSHCVILLEIEGYGDRVEEVQLWVMMWDFM
eukprot:10256999-Ditylum_brightwellii.AAC.1